MRCSKIHRPPNVPRVSAALKGSSREVTVFGQRTRAEKTKQKMSLSPCQASAVFKRAQAPVPQLFRALQHKYHDRLCLMVETDVIPTGHKVSKTSQGKSIM